MFGIGMMELLLISVAILVFVGPQKLPEMMRQAGRFFVHMRRTATEVRSTFDGVIRDAEAEIRREEFDKIKKVMEETRNEIQAPIEAEEYHPDHQHDHGDDHPHGHEGSDPHDPQRLDDPHHQTPSPGDETTTKKD